MRFSTGVGIWTSPGSMTGGSGVTYWMRSGQLSRITASTSSTLPSSTPTKTVVLPMRRKPPDDAVTVAEKPRRASRSKRLRLSSLLIIAMIIFMGCVSPCSQAHSHSARASRACTAAQMAAQMAAWMASALCAASSTTQRVGSAAANARYPARTAW